MKAKVAIVVQQHVFIYGQFLPLILSFFTDQLWLSPFFFQAMILLPTVLPSFFVKLFIVVVIKPPLFVANRLISFL